MAGSKSFISKEFLESACVSLYDSIMFLALSHCLNVFVVLLLFTPLCPLVFVYLIYTSVTWRTPSHGGNELGRDFMRNIWVFNRIRDYFPISLDKTSELNPQQNYILGYHPHAVLADGALVAFCSEALGFSDKFPGIVPHLAAHDLLLRRLVVRDIFQSIGGISVSRDSLEHALTKKGPGHSVVIIVGGSKEMMESVPETYNFILQKRKGFVKLALETGASLVPVLGFGENDSHPAFWNQRDSLTGNIIRAIHTWIGYYPPCLCCIMFGWLLRRRRPIHVVVGAPIEVGKVSSPSVAQVDELHAKYVQELGQLFADHRERCGVPTSTRLAIH